jgi:hypothetical protein
MSRLDVLRILEVPEFATPGSDGRYPRPLSEFSASPPPRIRYALDGRDTLSFSVPDTAEMRDLVTARRIVRVAATGEEVSEWLVSRTTQAAGPEGNGILLVECDPLRVVLADAGILEFVETGGQSFANLGGLNGSVRNYLATFVIPHLNRRNFTWIEIGTIDPVQQFDYSFDSMTALALIEGLAREVGAEWRLRRDAPNARYLIDVVDTVSGVIADIEAREGLNILSLVRQRNRERLFTSIRPSGALPSGSEERANIGWNAWRVTDVTGDAVSVVPHGGGIGAILENGQHVGLYLEAADGTFHEIEDSVESTQTFELESGAGASFAVNDDVAIVADDQGTLLTSVDSPSGIAASGFVQGSVSSRHLGHRNWVRNPAFAEWPDQPEVLTVQLNGTQNSTTINFKSFPPAFVVAVDTYFANSNGQSFRVTTGGTSDGSGNVTLTVSPTMSGADNTWFYWIEGPKTFPAPWEGTFFGAAWARHGAISQACNVDGTVAGSARLGLKNLPANFVIPGGTRVTAGNWAVNDTVADGAGLATVNVFPVVTATDGAALTLTRPAISGTGKVAGTPILLEGQSLRQSIQIRTIGATETVTFAATFAGYVATTGSIYDWSNTGTLGPRVAIQTSTGTPIQTGDFAELEFLAADTVQSATARVTRAIASGEYRWVVTPPIADGVTIFGGGGVWLLRSTMLYLGSESPPFVEGSAATRLFQDGQLALLASRQWPATYTARLSEIVSEWGLPANSPALALGSFLRVRSPSTGIDALLRVVAIEYDPTDPADKVFVLDSDPERLSTLSSRSRPRPVFVDVNVEVVDDRARQTVLVSESPPVAAPGAERFVVPEGSTAPVVNTPLPVSPFDPSGG